MDRKWAALCLSLTMLFSFIIIMVEISPQVFAPTTWYVDDEAGGNPPENFTSIQQAVEAASPGDTVFVYNGTYYEHVIINKTLNLTGEDTMSTIIDGGGSGSALRIDADFVNVTGFTLTNSDNGIFIVTSSNNKILSNNISNNNVDGIYLSSSSNNTLEHNTLTNNKDQGIYITQSSYNTIIWNNVTNNKDGIYISFSSNIIITYGNFSNNKGYGIYLWSSSNNTIKGNKVSLNSWDGICLEASSKNNSITNNEVFSNNFTGIFIYSSSNHNIIANNNVSYHIANGLYLMRTANNSLSNNSFFLDGVNIHGTVDSDYNSHTIADNNTVNGKPIYYYKDRNNFSVDSIPVGQLILTNCTNVNVSNLKINGTDRGIQLAYSTNISISRNNVSNNRVGIFLYNSSYNSLTHNLISENDLYGIRLWYSIYNKIYYNRILDNINQADDASDNGNSWEIGYPLGGNFWSDYIGEDKFKGPNQAIPGRDGIGDTPYEIDSNSRDNYPLMNPYKPLENYTILKQGWNLISVPLVQEEENLTRVLGGIHGWYDAAQWYDSKDKNDLWKHNEADKPYGNDLSELNETMGFWIHITQPGDTIFIYNGTQPDKDQTIHLYPGWNLVGYPSLANKNRTVGLNNLTFGSEVDAIWTFNAETQTWVEHGEWDNFTPGKGYWIHTKIQCKWVVSL